VRRLILLVLLLAAGVVPAACGERREPVGALPPSYPVTVTGAETTLVVRSRPQRVVALDPGSAELVLALGAGDELAGVPSGVTVPKSVHAVRVVKPTGQIDVGATVALHPDLVIATPESDRVDVSQIVERSGAELYLQPASTIEDVRRAALALGFALGHPVEARKLSEHIREQVGQVEARLGSVPPVRVFVDTGLFVTINDSSILGDLIRKARGENVLAGTGIGRVDLHELRAANPDVYLATSDSGVTLDSLRRNPDTRDLGAVERGRVVVVPADLVTRAGPNVAKALETVAAALHPDAFR